MNGDRVPVESSGAVSLEAIAKDGVREQPDVAGFASVDDHRLYLLLWHYHDDDLPGPDATMQLILTGLQSGAKTLVLEQYRIDADHSNAYSAWKKLGSPANPSPAQYAQVEKAGQLAKLATPGNIGAANGVAHMNLTLPRQAVALLVFRW
jgi:xylan 1,4-beta-xylosidase